MKALKGKKIGVTALSSATQYLATAMLNSAGLDATDVEFIAVGTGAPQALAARHVDAAVLTGPQIETSQMLGARSIIDLRSKTNCPGALDICGISQVGMWAMGDWIDQEPRSGAAHPQGDREGRRVPARPGQRRLREGISRQPHLGRHERRGARRLHRGRAHRAGGGFFAQADLERWIAIDFKGGVITQRMPVADVFADGTPESPQAVKDLAR